MKNWDTEIKELTNYRNTLSGKIPDLEKELEKLLEANEEVVVLLYSRRCLEVMVTEICKEESIKLGKTIPLKGIIDKLNKEEKVPSHIISSMLNLNTISTYGAHPKEFDPRQVQTVLINLVTVIEWYINYKGFETTNIETGPNDTHNIVLEEKEFTQTEITAKKTYKPLNFAQKLKRRKILHNLIIYTAISFSLLELIDITSAPLNLPDSVLTFVMYCTAIGLPIVIILSWFFKTTTNGIKLRQYLSVEKRDSFYPSDKLLNEKHKKGKEKISRVSSLVVIGSVLALFLFYSGKAISFTERDWIVITDFENLTEETIFDHSLNTAFKISIDQSRYVNVITRKRMQDVLKRMKKENFEHVGEELGREIAIREGIKVCIVPGISKVGAQYILTAKIQEAKTGTIFRSEILYAQNQDEIIEMLDQLSKKIRRNLGESRYEISGQSKALAMVTTPILDALKEFSLGIENHINMNFENAIIHYENAIRIDSNFTAAKASLGNLLYERFDKEKGRVWLEDAILSIDDLTDKEKYGILAFYAVNIENDLLKGIEMTRTRTELYPDDPIAHSNLGWYYQNNGYYEKAVDEYKLAIQIDPHMMLTYGGVIWTYLEKIGQIDSAHIWSKKMIKYGPENPWGYFYLGSCYVGLNDFDNAEFAYLKARKLNPNLMLNQYRLAHLYRIQGENNKAIEILKNILKMNPNEVSAHYDLGVNYSSAGNFKLSRNHFLIFKKYAERWEKEYPQNPATFVTLGAVLSRLGEKEAGWETGKKAIELDSAFHFRYAEFLATQDKKTEALDHLEKALENGYRDLVWIKLNPDIFLLHEEPRYKDLINQYFAEN
ncbi:MAG: tetratricopeptide repeat protein [Bacteroidota bacterium]